MEFQYEQTWDAMTSILALKTAASDAWSKFIDFHERVAPKTYWAQLRKIDMETRQSDIVEWLQQLLTNEPLPETVVAIWIGIFRSTDKNEDTPTIYMSGADSYSQDDAEWACDPTYLPSIRYFQPRGLKDLDNIIKAEANDYQFLDWIFPLAYCTFSFDDIFRTKIDKQLVLKNKGQIYVTVGYDGGDYIELTIIER